MQQLYQDQFYFLGLIALMPLLGAFINGIFGSRLPKVLVGVIGCGSILVSFILSLLSIRTLMAVTPDSHGYRYLAYTAYEWMYAGDFGVDLAFMIDPLTSLMLLLITGVGFLIHLYSVGYMEKDPSIWRYFSYLNLFCCAMLLLVLGKNMMVTFIGWEGVGVASYLLIGFWYEDDKKAMAGQKAFIVNRVGDFAFLVGMYLLYSETNTLDYLELAKIATGPGAALLMPVASAACILIFIGATGKSAQIPLYVWLPDAMAGPTPVSALMHAATMVTSGVFLLARLNWLLTLSWQAMMVVAWIGAFTAFGAATIALVQTDIKKVLAYSTVSQLGYMFLALGVGSFTGAVAHLMTHAFFKALLFLGSGSVIHTMEHAAHHADDHGYKHNIEDPQDITTMGGLGKHMPWTARTFLVGCLAISGFPLLSGFFSKDLILWKAFSNAHVFTATKGPRLDYLIASKAPEVATGAAVDVVGMAQITAYGTFVLGMITAGMTAFYMFRLYFRTFEGEFRGGDAKVEKLLHESPPTMTIPLFILAILAAVGGWTLWPHFIAHASFLPHSVGHALLGFEHWFEPVFRTAHDYRIIPRVGTHAVGLEIGVTVVSVALGLGGIFLARYMYIQNPELPESIRERAERVHHVLMNKYFVDEGYDFFFVRGSIKSGEVMTEFDQKLLDGVAVNGTAFGMASLGRMLRHLQSGNMQRYATYITLGVVLALAALMTM